MKKSIDLDWCGLRITARYEYYPPSESTLDTPGTGAECTIFNVFVQETDIIDILSYKQQTQIEELIIESYS
jgi:hypothetical protein